MVVRSGSSNFLRARATWTLVGLPPSTMISTLPDSTTPTQRANSRRRVNWDDSSQYERFSVSEDRRAPGDLRIYIHQTFPHTHRRTTTVPLLHPNAHIHPSNTPRTLQSSLRAFSILSSRRPMLFPPSTLSAPGPSSQLGCSSETLDLVGKISAHPGLGSMQIRCGPRDTYNPSHLVRKRRHGFLSRIRTKKGRKTLMRRVKKGRWNLSH